MDPQRVRDRVRRAARRRRAAVGPGRAPRGFLARPRRLPRSARRCPGLAPSLETLVAARVLQAAGAPFARCRRRSPSCCPSSRRRRARDGDRHLGGGRRDRRRDGAVVGGLLVEVSWRLVFLVNVPVGLVASVRTRVRLLRETKRRVRAVAGLDRDRAADGGASARWRSRWSRRPTGAGARRRRCSRFAVAARRRSRGSGSAPGATRRRSSTARCCEVRSFALANLAAAPLRHRLRGDAPRDRPLHDRRLGRLGAAGRPPARAGADHGRDVRGAHRARGRSLRAAQPRGARQRAVRARDARGGCGSSTRRASYAAGCSRA